MNVVKIVSQERDDLMVNSRKSDVRVRTPGGFGYERGLWFLIGCSGFAIFLLLAMESSRAKPSSFGFTPKVTVEKVPSDEARSMGLTYRNN